MYISNIFISSGRSSWDSPGKGMWCGLLRRYQLLWTMAEVRTRWANVSCPDSLCCCSCLWRRVRSPSSLPSLFLFFISLFLFFSFQIFFNKGPSTQRKPSVHCSRATGLNIGITEYIAWDGLAECLPEAPSSLLRLQAVQAGRVTEASSWNHLTSTCLQRTLPCQPQEPGAKENVCIFICAYACLFLLFTVF